MDKQQQELYSSFNWILLRHIITYISDLSIMFSERLQLMNVNGHILIFNVHSMDAIECSSYMPEIEIMMSQ
jgi:hypothetical protein